MKKFQVLNKSSGHSRDVLAVSCKMWGWAALPGKRAARFFCEEIACSKMTALCEAEQQEDRGYMSQALFTPREGNPGARVTLTRGLS